MESKHDVHHPHFAATSSHEESGDHKKTRRRALNRESACHTRMRKKVYVQQLESRSAKLSQLENQIEQCRKLGILLPFATDASKPKTYNSGSTDYLTFVSDYSQWLQDQSNHIQAVQTAINLHASTTDLQKIVRNATSHFSSLFTIKRKASKVDLCHIIYGMWTSPAECCMQWIGGFRSSNLLKVILNQMDSLSHQQITTIKQLQHITYQSEESITHGLEEMHRSVFQTLSSKTHSLPEGEPGVETYMGQMSLAIGQFSSLEHFLRQADQMRDKTLDDMHQILTTRQSAEALIHIHNYFSRLRAMSTLWVARQEEE